MEKIKQRGGEGSKKGEGEGQEEGERERKGRREKVRRETELEERVAGRESARGWRGWETLYHEPCVSRA